MSKPIRVNQAKRQRELSKIDKRKEKEVKRQQRKAEKADTPEGAEEEDPDLAGIVPGPQPVQE